MPKNFLYIRDGIVANLYGAYNDYINELVDKRISITSAAEFDHVMDEISKFINGNPTAIEAINELLEPDVYVRSEHLEEFKAMLIERLKAFTAQYSTYEIYAHTFVCDKPAEPSGSKLPPIEALSSRTSANCLVKIESLINKKNKKTKDEIRSQMQEIYTLLELPCDITDANYTEKLIELELFLSCNIPATTRKEEFNCLFRIYRLVNRKHHRPNKQLFSDMQEIFKILGMQELADNLTAGKYVDLLSILENLPHLIEASSITIHQLVNDFSPELRVFFIKAAPAIASEISLDARPEMVHEYVTCKRQQADLGYHKPRVTNAKRAYSEVMKELELAFNKKAISANEIEDRMVFIKMFAIPFDLSLQELNSIDPKIIHFIVLHDKAILQMLNMTQTSITVLTSLSQPEISAILRLFTLCLKQYDINLRKLRMFTSFVREFFVNNILPQKRYMRDLSIILNLPRDHLRLVISRETNWQSLASLNDFYFMSTQTFAKLDLNSKRLLLENPSRSIGLFNQNSHEITTEELASAIATAVDSITRSIDKISSAHGSKSLAYYDELMQQLLHVVGVLKAAGLNFAQCRSIYESFTLLFTQKIFAYKLRFIHPRYYIPRECKYDEPLKSVFDQTQTNIVRAALLKCSEHFNRATSKTQDYYAEVAVHFPRIYAAVNEINERSKVEDIDDNKISELLLSVTEHLRSLVDELKTSPTLHRHLFLLNYLTQSNIGKYAAEDITWKKLAITWVENLIIDEDPQGLLRRRECIDKDGLTLKAANVFNDFYYQMSILRCMLIPKLDKIAHKFVQIPDAKERSILICREFLLQNRFVETKSAVGMYAIFRFQNTIPRAIINTRNSAGNTSLLQAIANHDSRTALALIENGADLHMNDKDGNSVLSLAKQRQMGEVVREIRQRVRSEQHDVDLTGTTMLYRL